MPAERQPYVGSHVRAEVGPALRSRRPAEIGGAWLVWQGVREHRGAAWIGGGIAALGAYGFVATLQDENEFGRILAPYGVRAPMSGLAGCRIGAPGPC